jgi:hypothetical protein
MARVRNESLIAEAARLYHGENLTAAEVATRLGRNERTVRRWLDGTLRRTGPRLTRLPEAWWQQALRAGADSAAEVTVLCPEHQPGGRVLAAHVTLAEARKAADGHYATEAHSGPWVMPAEHWDWLIRTASGQ